MGRLTSIKINLGQGIFVDFLTDFMHDNTFGIFLLKLSLAKYICDNKDQIREDFREAAVKKISNSEATKILARNSIGFQEELKFCQSEAKINFVI